jgi:tetratricopeptide (TPR) repeat protein
MGAADDRDRHGLVRLPAADEDQRQRQFDGPVAGLPAEVEPATGAEPTRMAEASTAELPHPAASPLVAPLVPPPVPPEVTDRVSRLAEHAMSLAARGAHFSARAEFIQVLRAVAQALDAQSGGQHHSQALGLGLRALEEADDFIPRGSQLESDLDIPGLIAAHRTPVLQYAGGDDRAPLEALEHYYEFAQQQLALAGGREPAAARALFGLARLQPLLDGSRQQGTSDAKMIALLQAALMVDRQHFAAANELGVLLARYGQLERARDVLQQSAAAAARVEIWHNLAVVHQRLGEAEQARTALENKLQTARMQQPAAGSDHEEIVVWVDAPTLARAGGAEEYTQSAVRQEARPADPPAPAAPSAGPSRTGWLPAWLQPKR